MKTQICSYCCICIFIYIIFYLINFYNLYPINYHHVSDLMQYYRDCDLFDGQWIRDMEQPLYTNKTCPTMGDPRDCFKNGRKDTDFLKWRWKPDGCQLSRFNPNLFLEIVRGKTMAFIGDSVARNQIESLLCLLSQGETPVIIYRSSDDRILRWYFPKHDFTLMIIWTVFLVQEEEIIGQGSKTDNYTLHLDKVHQVWNKHLPPVLDYAVISSGQWFFERHLYLYKHGVLAGCVYCNEPNIPKRDHKYALRMSIRTALKYTERFKRITIVLRTFSPPHFENGKWNTGGSCRRTSPYNELADAKVLGASYDRTVEFRQVQLEELERAKRKGGKDRRLLALDVTRASLMRPDGHPDIYNGMALKTGIHDCVHWCLPGPIDAWNDLFLGTLLKETSPRTF